MLMKVILLQKIRNFGNLGDIVQVKPGYSRNYLIPQEKAVKATKENIAIFETRRAEFEKQATEVLNVAQKRAEQLKDLSITIARRAMEEGKLFGSVGIRDIVNAIAEKGITVNKNEVNLPYGPIHEVGEYEIEIQLHSDVSIPVKVIVEAG